MSESVWEEYSSYSFGLDLLDWEIIDDLSFDQMLDNDFFSKKMHISPFDSRFHSLEYS